MKNVRSLSLGLLLVMVSPMVSCATEADSDVDFGPYMKILENRMQAGWHPPKAPQAKVVVVYFIINKNGSLSGLRISRSSGVKALDDAALAAVRAQQPFAPLPEGAKESQDVEFTFDYRGISTVGETISHGSQISDTIRGEAEGADGDRTKLSAILLNHAVRAMNLQNYKGAAAKYAALLHLDRTNAVAAAGFEQAVSHLPEKTETKDSDKLLTAGEQAILDKANSKRSVFSGDVAQRNNEAVKALLAKKYGQAIEGFLEVLKLAPDYSIAKDNLGIAYNNYGLELPAEKALNCFYQSLLISPTNKQTADNLAVVATELDPSKPPIRDIIDKQKAKLRLDDSAQQHLALGLAYELAENWSLAEAEYHRALELDSASEATELLHDMSRRKTAYALAKAEHAHDKKAAAPSHARANNRPASRSTLRK